MGQSPKCHQGTDPWESGAERPTPMKGGDDSEMHRYPWARFLASGRLLTRWEETEGLTGREEPTGGRFSGNFGRTEKVRRQPVGPSGRKLWSRAETVEAPGEGGKLSTYGQNGSQGSRETGA